MDWWNDEVIARADFWNVIHDVHKGTPLRESVEAHRHFADKMNQMGIERKPE